MIDANLSSVAHDVPPGDTERKVSDSLARIRAANQRIQHLLGDALDPRDDRARYHETGGSG